MPRIRLTREEAAALDRGEAYTKSRFLPGQRGPQTTWYHNPTTGQEFQRLPVDPWNLMKQIRKGIIPGRATEEMREKWAEHQKQLSDPAEEFIAEGEAIVAEHQKNNENNKAIAELTKKIEALTAIVMGQQAPTTEVTEEVEEKGSEEPVQLGLEL